MKKPMELPAELAAFLAEGHTVLHARDGDWELRIEVREDSGYGESLPPRALVIAENGSGDCLFLKLPAAGKRDLKVYVYWHEEEQTEIFAKTLGELMAATGSQEPSKKEAPAAEQPMAPAAESLVNFEQTLTSADAGIRMGAWRAFKNSGFGLEALPMLRRLLAVDNVSIVNDAAECIGRLGSGARDCPAAQALVAVGHGHADTENLEKQLRLVGSRLWSYSGYTNSYSACLDALVDLGYHEDLEEYVHLYIGLRAPFDVRANCRALAQIGTDAAMELLVRAEAFWMPELNLAEGKKIKAIIASAGKTPAANKPRKK